MLQRFCRPLKKLKIFFVFVISTFIDFYIIAFHCHVWHLLRKRQLVNDFLAHVHGVYVLNRKFSFCIYVIKTFQQKCQNVFLNTKDLGNYILNHRISRYDHGMTLFVQDRYIDIEYRQRRIQIVFKRISRKSYSKSTSK